MTQALEPVMDRIDPGLVVVVGDVNSTLAAALVAVKKGTRVAHVEAGLRSFDRSLPEEINRVLTDQISELLFTTERDAIANLQREGIVADKVFFVGNVMIDSQRMRGRPRRPSGTTPAVDENTARISGGRVAAHHNVGIAALLEVRIKDRFAGRTPPRLNTLEKQLLSTNASDDVLY